MMFSVVFTVDAPHEDLPRIRRSLRRRLGCVRGETEYAYLGGAWERAVSDGGSGVLTRHEFAALLEDLGNPAAEDARTLGTLGGPLAPWGGVVPDVSFSGDSADFILSMRVTPIPSRGNSARDADDAERKWERIRRAMLRRYESGWDAGAYTCGPKYAAAVKRERASAPTF